MVTRTKFEFHYKECSPSQSDSLIKVNGMVTYSKITCRVLDNGVPAVGSYDVKEATSTISHSFLKSDRFADSMDSGNMSISRLTILD